MTMNNEDNYLLSDNIIFDSKPEAVPFNYRISYKMGQVCLLLDKCGGRKSLSIVQIQMIATSMNNEEEKKNLLAFCSSNNRMLVTTVRFDPAINRILKYAVADGMVRQLVQGTFRLTDKGKKFVKIIMNDDCLMKDEKDFLNKLSDGLTQEKIADLIQVWRYKNASNK